MARIARANDARTSQYAKGPAEFDKPGAERVCWGRGQVSNRAVTSQDLTPSERREGGVSKVTVSALAAGLLAVGAAGAAQAPEKRDVAQVFAETCAACHGAKLQGGQAASLVDDAWMHGGDDASLARSIREGQPDAGMPAFGAPSPSRRSAPS